MNKRLMQYAADGLDGPAQEETPEERNARINRNWQELKKARMFALKTRNQKAVDVLDQELEAGRGTDFPDDSDFIADDDFVPDSVAPKVPAKRGFQGDVRRSEPSMALILQEAAERDWERANLDFIKKTGGVLKPGQSQSQAVSAVSGLRDPSETRQDAESQHAIDTGELKYGDSVLYNVVKPAAAIAGFSAAGPVGATAADALARGIAVGYNIDKALDKGMDPDQAADIVVREMVKGVAVDALFNFGTPVVFELLAKIPGLKRIGNKITEKLIALGAPKPRMELRDAKLAERKALTDNPARQKAVDELASRVEGDYIPTKGQVKGKVGFMEKRTVEAFPGQFELQEEALGKAAEQMRKEVVSAGSQPTAPHLGQQVERFVESTVKATKDRLRPVFEEANAANVIVDFKDIAAIAANALRKNAEVVGKGKLTKEEVAHLQGIIDDYKFQPYSFAEPTLDFLSVQKEALRSLNPTGKPSDYFGTIVGNMTKAAKDAYFEGARRAGKGELVKKLVQAWDDYRVMMGSAYQGSMKQALVKGEHAPEEIGPYLWTKGKVTRINELDEMLKLGAKEGVASPQAIEKMRRNVARGFLQQGVQNVDQAAKWSENLADPQRKATWDALTRTPAGAALKDTMNVLEQAAQIATVKPSGQQARFLTVPFSRAVGGGLGFSWVTGAVSPVIAGIGLSVAGTVRLAATAFTHGDKGTLNLLQKVIRANNAGTAASAKALEQLLPQLAEAAKKYEEDPFIREEQLQQLGDTAVKAADDPLGIRTAVTGAK